MAGHTKKAIRMQLQFLWVSSKLTSYDSWHCHDRQEIIIISFSIVETNDKVVVQQPHGYKEDEAFFST